MSLALRDTPYASEHRSSVEAGMERGRKPEGLDALIAWFMDGYREENPPRIHRSDLDDGGVPDLAGEFRRYIDAPSSIDDDGYYVTPIRAAMARLEREGKPLMARTLFQLAQCDGNWVLLSQRLDWPLYYCGKHLERALGILWSCFHYRKM